MVKWTFRFLPLIPKSEIQAEVVFELFVVQRMMGGADQPFSQNMPVEIFRIDLNVEVVNDAAESHECQLYYQHIKVHWQNT